MAEKQQFDRSEFFYRPTVMHAVFGAVTLGLIASLLAVVYADWNREWKQYQAMHRDLQEQKTRQSIQEETEKAKAKVADIEERLAEAQEDFEKRSRSYAEAQEALKEAESEFAGIRVKFQAQKSVTSEKKYNYELKKAKNPTSEKAQGELKNYREEYKKAVDVEEVLRNEYNTAQKKVNEAEDYVKSFKDEINALEKELTLATADLGRYERNLVQLEANLFNNAFRDVPLLDFIAPIYTIKQHQIPEIKDDLHFVKVSKIDRCHTCHVSIATPGFEDAPQPLTTHPDLELYVTDQSPHPAKLMGCTVCHEGNGMATEFNRAAHTPRDYDQQKEWEDEYHWHKLHHWEWPMWQKGMVEQSCYKCHTNPETIPEAATLLHGHTLFLQKGCYACHSIDKPQYQDLRHPGPTLTKIAQKLTPEFTRHWIADPWHYRPDSPMPQLFYLENTDTPLGRAQDDVMVEATVRYLFETASDEILPAPPVEGDADSGRILVKQVGCLGCHVIDDLGASAKDSPNYHESNHGPNLNTIGSKTNYTWLYHWVKDPKHYWEETVMPSMRLTEQESADVAAYLMTLQGAEEFFDQPIPTPRDEIIDGLIQLDLQSKMADADIAARLADMTQHEKLMELGQKAIKGKQCYSCHEITGFENENPIVLNFNEQGKKDIDQIDFGFISKYPSKDHVKHAKKAGAKLKSYYQHPHTTADSAINAPISERPEILGRQITGAATLRFGAENVPYATADGDGEPEVEDLFVKKTRQDWFYNQIKNPKVWDRGKGKNWWETLKMGQFGLTDAESHALALFISAQRSTEVGKFRDAMDEAHQALAEGRQAMKLYNCQACHSVGLYEDKITIKPLDPNDKYAGGEVVEVDPSITRLWAASEVMGHIDIWPDDPDATEPIGQDIQPVVERDRWLLGDLWDKFTDPANPDYFPLADFLVSFEVNEVPVYGRHEGWIRQYYDDITIAPPVLYQQGKKTKPGWLYEWLLNVHTIRPHIYVRMPQFNYRNDDAEDIVHFFAAKDGEPWPLEEYMERGNAEELVNLGHEVYSNLVKCNLCHPAGDSMPTNSDMLAWAPNLALAQERLKTDWLKNWFRNPQGIYPGTKMPNNFYQPDGDGLKPIIEGQEETYEQHIDALTHWFHQLDSREAAPEYTSLFEFAPPAQADVPADTATEEDEFFDNSMTGEESDEWGEDPAEDEWGAEESSNDDGWGSEDEDDTDGW